MTRQHRAGTPRQPAGRARVRHLGVGLAIVLLAGCGGAPQREATPDHSGIADAVPQVEPKARYGNMDSYVVFGRRYHTKDSSRNHVERGVASWYGKKFHGRKTSSGERYDMHQMTAAHKTLPLPSYVTVTNLDNGRQAVVKVNDRGPFHGNRVIDLSYAAAKKLDVVRKGTARVEVRSIDPRDHGGQPPQHARTAAAKPAATPAKPAATPTKPATVKVHRRSTRPASSPWLDMETAPVTAANAKPKRRSGPEPSPWIDAGQPTAAGERSTAPAKTAGRAAEPVGKTAAPVRIASHSKVTTATPAPKVAEPIADTSPVRPATPTVAAAEPAAETVPARVTAAPTPKTRSAITARPAPAASVAAAAEDDRGVYLQVGAFGSKENADQLRSRLLAQVSAPVQVRSASSGDAPLFKVQVGPLPSRDQAGDMTRRLTALGISSAMLVAQ